MQYIFPFTPVWFRQRQVFRSRGYFTEKIQSAIIEDPEIADSSHIGIQLEKPGMFSKRKLHLVGAVHSEKDRARAEELARENSRDVVEVVNDIKVEHDRPRPAGP